MIIQDKSTLSALGAADDNGQWRYKPTYEELNQYLYTTTRQLKGMTQQTRKQQAELDSLEQELKIYKAIPQSLAYQLGKALIDAGTSVKGLKRLPGELLRLRALSKSRRARKAYLDGKLRA